MKLVTTLVIGLAVGFGLGWVAHPDNTTNIQKAINSGGLTIDK